MPSKCQGKIAQVEWGWGHGDHVPIECGDEAEGTMPSRNVRARAKRQETESMVRQPTVRPDAYMQGLIAWRD